MSPYLEEILARRWAAVFRDRDEPPTASLMCFGCEHGDGWFGILDALCETMTQHARALGRDPPRAVQVKEKFGGLRFYATAADDHDHGAIAVAEAVSMMTCEVTGHPGQLCTSGGWYATRAPTAMKPGYKPVSGKVRSPLPSTLAEAAAQVRENWGPVLAGPIEIPPGWCDLLEALRIGMREHIRHEDGAPRAASVRVWTESGRLVVQHASTSDAHRGMSDFITAMSARIDPVSGICGIPPNEAPEIGGQHRG